MGMKRAMMIGLDGADPVRVKKLIAEGRMPNMKKLLEKGIATENLDMLGVLPAGTPPNWKLSENPWDYRLLKPYAGKIVGYYRIKLGFPPGRKRTDLGSI